MVQLYIVMTTLDVCTFLTLKVFPPLQSELKYLLISFQTMFSMPRKGFGRENDTIQQIRGRLSIVNYIIFNVGKGGNLPVCFIVVLLILK